MKVRNQTMSPTRFTYLPHLLALRYAEGLRTFPPAILKNASGFSYDIFLRVWDIEPSPNPQPGRPGVAIGPLQLAIHVVQNRRAGEQKSHWEKTNKKHT